MRRGAAGSRRPKEFSMKSILITALSGDNDLRLRGPIARRRSSDGPGLAERHGSADDEGYGPSSAIVCDQAGTTCWHSVERYDYPPNANLVIHPYDWQADNGANYAWREHPGRGYWQREQWQQF
jgi:hypothetical protein